MSFGCPICNGLEFLRLCCPSCQVIARDYGRSIDFIGPYSPYRPIDEMRLTNGIPDLAAGVCVHLLGCPTCEETFSVPVKEVFL